MNKRKKGAWLAAGLIAGAAALTGCAAQTTPVATPTPQTLQKATAQPAAASPDSAKASPEPSESAAGEETPGPIELEVEGELLKTGAVREEGRLLLPLIETAEVLGWAAEEETVEEETNKRRTVALTKGESVISVTWVVSDNTVSKVSWQKDGLLIPVNPKITTIRDVVYVPAAFFEEAMEVLVSEKEKVVSLSLPKEKATPQTQEQSEETSDKQTKE